MISDLSLVDKDTNEVIEGVLHIKIKDMVHNQIGSAVVPAPPRSYRTTSKLQNDSFLESSLRDSAFFGGPTGLATSCGC